MTTSDTEPALLAYAWTGTPEDLADQNGIQPKRQRKPLTFK